MKKFTFVLLVASVYLLPACSSEKTNTNTEAASSSEAATADDSSTTNPINSEYGTPNSSENPVDSAQSKNEEK
ncbi:hypothetical protein [Adhaeribacter rhizoryzae]|uniref:Uncharacterized protein n=1 Tax=Adhaeribacter rhizoryzae TaxID=2607907 RepID=A0A5M6D7U9_9BACT|nr:hypothetical protein [Adhaeribacter rhizoryzae]KAA5541245.1 hypothetical protein F0145_20800 [Adhaeribacter rhizoryzae]